MNREIIFRAKAIDKNEWHYGFYRQYPIYKSCGKCLDHINHFIDCINGSEFIDPNTLGQFTGLKDKNGVDIYEGDIINCKIPKTGIREIKYFSCYGMFGMVGKSGWSHPKDVDAPLGSFGSSTKYKPFILNPYYQQHMEVIGNIHDKPELLNDK